MKEIFISYAWNDSKKVDKFYQFFQDNFAEDIKLRRDRFDNSQWDNIDDFMNTISLCDYAILFISDKYLKSKNCMYEAIRLIEHSNYHKKLLAIILDPDKVYGGTDKIGSYIDYWKKQKESCEDKNSKNREYLGEIYENEIKMYESILNNISKVFKAIQSIINPSYSDSFIVLENIILGEKDYYVDCSKKTEVLADKIGKVMEAEENNYCEVFKYYSDNCFIEKLNIYEIIKEDIKDLPKELKVYLCKYLWYKCFVGEQSVDYRYIYILIYLLRDEKVEVDFKRFNQDVGRFEPRFIEESYSLFSDSNMGALYYVLEQCPYIYNKLSSMLKSLLLSGCKKNLTTLIREYYLFPTAKEQICEIKSAVIQNSNFIKNNSKNKCVWNWLDLIDLCKHRKEELEMRRFILDIFSDSKSYDESKKLWKVIEFLLPNFTVEEQQELLNKIESNSQIYDNSSSKYFFEKYKSITNTIIDISDYPNWKNGIEKCK